MSEMRTMIPLRESMILLREMPADWNKYHLTDSVTRIVRGIYGQSSGAMKCKLRRAFKYRFGLPVAKFSREARPEKGYQLLLFSSISWQQYMIIITVALSAYYLSVIAVYYRKEILKLPRLEWLRKKSTAQSATQQQDPLAANDALLFSSVHQLVEELKTIFQAAASKQFQKEEILMAFQVKLRSYQQLKGTPFQIAVNNHIAQQSQVQCGIMLDDAEIKQLW